MFLTKECDYGIRIIRALADGQKRTAEEICAIESIPGQFAYKILKKMERGGFLQSCRGRDGGYWLVRSLDEISIHDIIETIDEYLYLNECLRDDRPCSRNPKSSPCGVHHELMRIQEKLIKELQQTSIREFV
ncbi:MAG: Rrf2 family transcriptional regulator [Oscillospiraceae bacterium]|nr:Rrf2 family transcriptional regulator [Oscillospiraceae bacterium]